MVVQTNVGLVSYFPHTILVLALGTFHNFHTSLNMGDNFTQL